MPDKDAITSCRLFSIFFGGSVAEWSACGTRNPAVLGWSPVLIQPGFVSRSPELQSYFLATLVNSQLICLLPVVPLVTMLCSVSIICFSCLLGSTCNVL